MQLELLCDFLPLALFLLHHSHLDTGARQNGQKEIQETRRFHEIHIGQLLLARFPGALPGSRGIFQSACQNQLLPGPGHGHIKQPQFLGQALLLQLSRQGGSAQCLVADTPDGVYVVRGQAQIHVQYQGLVHVLHVEPLAQARHKGDGEFQPFALVDAHDAHHIRVLVQQLRSAVVHVVFFQLFHVADEMEQAEVAGLLKIRCLLLPAGRAVT